MALRRSLSKRLFGATNRDSPPRTTTTLEHTLIPPPSTAAVPNEAQTNFADSSGFFRRFLQRRAINNHSSPTALASFLALPVGDKLREKLNSLHDSGNHRLLLDGLRAPLPPAAGEEGRFSVSVADAKRVLRFVQMEKIRERVKNIPASTVQYGEFVRICGDVCGNKEMGLDFAKAFDESGNVIVLGGVVFLRPDQVAKSIEKLISENIAIPNDPRRKELAHLKNEKAQIDQKAQSLVRLELYFGLGVLVLQTLGFMRLTFWELSWDVMEPICFFVGSIHFLLGWAFFLRTAKEPNFEGYFQRRFKVKQKKLMKIHNFDLQRYNQLCEAFYGKY